MEHHPAKAGEAAAAAGGEHLVGIAAAAVQGKEIHGAQAVPVVLLAEHIANEDNSKMRQNKFKRFLHIFYLQ